MKKLISVFFYGYGILLCAFVTNWLGNYAGFKSWYEIFGNANFYEVSPTNQIWLVVIYPLLLGISIYLLNRIWSIFIKGNL